eukprot:9476022-Pyramimonas_sp.AAC.3
MPNAASSNVRRSWHIAYRAYSHSVTHTPKTSRSRAARTAPKTPRPQGEPGAANTEARITSRIDLGSEGGRPGRRPRRQRPTTIVRTHAEKKGVEQRSARPNPECRRVCCNKSAR